MNDVGVIVPTLNAGPAWQSWLTAFESQSSKPDLRLVIDSSSTDDTAALARHHGFKVKIISRTEFNHGGTRQQAVALLEHAQIIIFVTQDAILAAPDAIEQLLRCFEDQRVGAAYGRQLPHAEARPIGAHARLFNYPSASQVRVLGQCAQLGIKAAFISNSFAAYRRSALLEVGGFPIDTIMNEDTCVAGKMLLNDWKVTYCADARVHHSHDYRFRDDFKRYFDIGVFHAREAWMQKSFGSARNEGRRFVISELKYLCQEAPWLLPSAITRTGLKWLGFRVGGCAHALPVRINQRLSMHRNYWERDHTCVR